MVMPFSKIVFLSKILRILRGGGSVGVAGARAAALVVRGVLRHRAQQVVKQSCQS